MAENCNEKNCTCTKTDCLRHGKCCACINRHCEDESLVYCMRQFAVISKE
jgi:hypothetical protein